MTILTANGVIFPKAVDTQKPNQPKQSWPLMGDVATIRAGVPEALIQWRRARGEPDTGPCDPWD